MHDIALWRIAVEAPGYRANDMRGAGAQATGGRWNGEGVPMVYCSRSIALAVLETFGHLRAAGLPFNRFLVRIGVPEEVWNGREILVPPGGWDAIPAGGASRDAGDRWIAGRRSALLEVPSVIVPEESNVLVNPLHPDARRLAAATVRRWSWDPRFF